MKVWVCFFPEWDNKAQKKSPMYCYTGEYIPSKSILHFLSVFQEFGKTDISQRVLQQTED